MGVSPKQFDEMQRRTRGSRRAAAPLLPDSRPGPTTRHRLILGIDPSLRGTGYGIIRLAKPAPECVAAGEVRCPAAWARSRCLLAIVEAIRDMTRQHAPTVCVVEGLFYAQNLRTAIVLGEARGASLVAAAEAGLEIVEIAPRKVKQAIVGYGAAQKIAVARMVQRMLNLAEAPGADAADALALALTYAQEQNGYSLTPLKRL